MAGFSSYEATYTPDQAFPNMPMEESTYRPTATAAPVHMEAAATTHDMAASYDAPLHAQPIEVNSDEDPEESNNSEDNEINAPSRTDDGKWCCGWFDFVTGTRCNKTWRRECDLT
jgi:hypothetical protein